jgi:hypothetical protein
MSYKAGKVNLCISAKILQFSIITILFSYITINTIIAQDTTYKKHEWGIAYEPLFEHHYFELHYKTFLKKKVYYNFHIGSLLNKHSTNLGKSTEFMFVPSAEFGVSLPFFRIFRFNAAARVTGYVRQIKFDYNDSRSDGYNKRIGLFFGPDLGLEIVPYMNNKIQFSIFGDAHSGYGPMNEKYFFPPSPVNSPSTTWEFRNNSITGTFFGRVVLGISIRY